MRIAFVCSSLEPGRDGVGDYARLLAEECVRQGHACILIALHDRHISEPICDELSSIPLLRLPAKMPWPERVSKAEAFQGRFAPDCASLHFVPYGFQDKGIVFGLAPRLREILRGVPKLHIMFHELWIGAPENSPWRHRVVGALQRHYILRLVKKLQPALIHTHAPVYAALLREGGVSAAIMPLFGNIPVAAAADSTWLSERLAAAGFGPARDHFWLVGFFGTLHAEWMPEPFFGILHRAAETAGKRVCILAIGRLGPGSAKWEQMARDYAAWFSFLDLGRLSAEKVSQAIQVLDFAIATSPLRLIGKSSTAATFFGHGVPVVITRDEIRYKSSLDDNSSRDPAIHLLDSSLESKLASGLPKLPVRDSLAQTAARLVSEISA